MKNFYLLVFFLCLFLPIEAQGNTAHVLRTTPRDLAKTVNFSEKNSQETVSKSLKAANADLSCEQLSVQVDMAGNQHVKYSVFFKNVVIENTVYIAHFNSDTLLYMEGVDLSIAPKISPVDS